MAEKGGRACKEGARYEDKCIINQLLDVLYGINYSVTIEPTGKDEKVTDMIAIKANGLKEHIQCKSSNGFKAIWSVSDLISNNLLKGWKEHLIKEDDNICVALMSPYKTELDELIYRARNSGDDATVFYHNQINNKKLSDIYIKYCEGIGVKPLSDDGLNIEEIERSRAYLKRIHILPWYNTELDSSIERAIQNLFARNADYAYDALLSWIVDGDILGQEITYLKIKEYFEKKEIYLKLQEEKEDSVCLSEINKSYSCRYRYINGKQIARKEFEECIKLIEEDSSFVISGHAGAGKSGCTEAIIMHCVEKNIPYIAIKLDVSIPRDNASRWGEHLGLSTSIPIVMHKMSLNSKAVIIFDQLDALRWTQANSYRAIEVCMEVIDQVRRLNQERQEKLLVVFVCRSYDLVNDNNIKMIFNQKEFEGTWSKVEVGELEEHHVMQIVGDNYAHMSSKLKKLLRTPSNLFIWEQIKDKEGGSKKCEASGQLLQYWYQELCRRCRDYSINEGSLKKQIDSFVTLLDKKGRLFIPKILCGIDSDIIDYLVSEGFLTVDGNNIGFVHQSILDYLISVKMFNGFYADESIEEIVGPKHVQTPTKRYQVLMLLQNIMETDTNDFIRICNMILESQEVRYCIKSLVFEVIAQNNKADSIIFDYVIENIQKGKGIEHWISDVVFGNNIYISLLLDRGILAQWFDEPYQKRMVFKLLRSVRSDLTDKEIRFMDNRSFLSEEDDRMFASVISILYPTDSSDIIDYTIRLFENRPELIKTIHFQVSKMLPYHEKAISKLLGIWYANNDEYNLGESDYTEDLSMIEIQDGKTILDILLPYVPKEKIPGYGLYKWQANYDYKKSVERQIVEIICAANRAIIKNNPLDFWPYYKKYLGKDFSVFNEIIIRALSFIPEKYSDDVINYIGRNLDGNIFDVTSGAEDKLFLTKQVVAVHVMTCSDIVYKDFENKLLYFVPKNAIKKYRERIEDNRKKEWGWTDRPYWGKLQHELLAVIPTPRLSLQARELLKVLDRRFETYSSKYTNSKMAGGIVKSAVSDKKISERQWLQIITNKNIPDRKIVECTSDGIFIHSDVEAFSESFRIVVEDNPNKMLKLVLDNIDRVHPRYIDAILVGCIFSSKFEEVKFSDLEKLLDYYTCPMEISRSINFLEAIEKWSDKNWSERILNKINEIVKQDDSNDSVKAEEKRKELDGRALWDYSVNSMRGHAAIAIGRLISQREDLFEKFKVSIKLLADSSSATDRMAALFPLRVSYNIDKKWASKYIISIFERDIRTIALQERMEMLVPLYWIYPKRITNILKRGFESNDKNVVDIAASSLCYIYMMNGDFSSLILNKNNMNEEQVKSIMYMAVSCLGVDEKRDKAKKLILELADLPYDLEFPLSRIFYEKKVDKKDREFLIEILSMKNGRRLLHAFISFIEGSAISIKGFADIIINLSNSILNKSDDEINSQWGVADELLKVILALYDECTGTENADDKKYAEKCMDIWDVMLERQLEGTRKLSKQLMDR